MFTGLIETTVVLANVEQASPNGAVRLVCANPWPPDEVATGDSVALDGICLTVVENDRGQLTFEAATETVKRTTVNAWRPGKRLHVERALRLGDRLDGHMVAGHVDAVATLSKRERRGSALYLGVQMPEVLLPLCAKQGSVTLCGVSLTIADVEGAMVWVALIPHTLVVTTLGALAVGDALNVEVDLIARYVARQMAYLTP